VFTAFVSRPGKVHKLVPQNVSELGPQKLDEPQGVATFAQRTCVMMIRNHGCKKLINPQICILQGCADHKLRNMIDCGTEEEFVFTTERTSVVYDSDGKGKYIYILINILKCFSSPELKVQVSFSDRWLSVVRLSVRPSVLRLSVRLLDIFDFFSRTAGTIVTKVGTNHP
jgi:hypothetical protein